MLPTAERSKLLHTPLMFDPGERWHYGGNIDWVGRGER
jgi:methyl acetate hydrolase